MKTWQVIAVIVAAVAIVNLLAPTSVTVTQSVGTGYTGSF